MNDNKADVHIYPPLLGEGDADKISHSSHNIVQAHDETYQQTNIPLSSATSLHDYIQSDQSSTGNELGALDINVKLEEPIYDTVLQEAEQIQSHERTILDGNLGVATQGEDNMVVATLLTGSDGQLYQVKFVETIMDATEQYDAMVLDTGDGVTSSAVVLDGGTVQGKLSGAVVPTQTLADFSGKETLVVIESPELRTTDLGQAVTEKEQHDHENVSVKKCETSAPQLNSALLHKDIKMEDAQGSVSVQKRTASESSIPSAKKTKMASTSETETMVMDTAQSLAKRISETKTKVASKNVTADKRKKVSSTAKRLESLDLLSSDSDLDSVLNMGGKVGAQIRANFCKLMNSTGPSLITCRQCIQQVKRARVFPDSKESLSNLLNHIALHEEIREGGDGDEETLSENLESEKETVATAKKTMESGPSNHNDDKSRSTSGRVSLIRKSLSTVEKSKLIEDSLNSRTDIVIAQEDADGKTTDDVISYDCLVPEPAARPSSESSSLKPCIERYSCVICNIDMSNFDEFIAHTTEHNKSSKTSDKDSNKAVMVRSENAHFSFVSPDDDDDSKLQLQTTDDPNDNLMSEMQFKLEHPSEQSRLLIESITEHITQAVSTNAASTRSNSKKKRTGKSKKSVDKPAVDVKCPFLCMECGDGEPTSQLLRQHMTRMHGDRARVFVCKLCNMTWSEKNYIGFQDHNMKHHPGEDISCYFCQLKFNSCEELKYHHAQHRPPLNYCCPYCYHEFSWLLDEDFSAHVTRHQEEENPFRCRDCGSQFADFVQRRVHQMALGHDQDVQKFHDELRPYICTGCGKQFVNTGRTTGVCALRRHVCHSGVTLDPSFECPYCKILFPLARKLREHMRQKHEHHVCHICSTICMSKASLDEHIGSEHFGGQFVCPVCQESFDTSQKMKQHRTREHGARDYICEFCGQGFAARLLLVRHLKKHDEFQSFVCTVCGDKFLLADRLETHFRKYHAHVVSAQEYETIILDNVQTALAAETIAIIQE